MNIAIEKLQKRYQERLALDLPSLELEKGRIYGIVGPNGSGKTTLLSIIAGLDTPSEGRVYYGPQRSVEFPYREITMVFQQPYMLRTTTMKNIAYPLRLRGAGEAECKERTAELAAELGLTGLLRQKAWTLSAGEMQKTALARALSFHPRLLLLDEATANIDPATTAEIERMLRKINREEGTTILLITHNLGQVKRLCDHVIFLNEGRVIERGQCEDFLLHPVNEATQRFLAGELVL